MQIKEIMNKAIAADFDMSLKEAAKIMSQKNIGSLIVMKQGDILGIVTKKDIINNINDTGKKISSVMSKDVITIEESQDINNAAELMAKNKIKRLPVMKNGELVGIITSTDLIAHSDELDEEFLF